LTRTHAAVVAAAAEALGVAARTETAVVARNPLVALEPVGAVLRIVEPRGRLEPTLGKGRDELRSPGQVACRTGARCFARLGHVARVAAEAASHARQLVGRRLGERADVAVARLAVDGACGVHRVIELEVRRREHGPEHALAVLRAVPDVAERARTERVRAGLHLALTMVRPMARVAACSRRKQQLGARAARLRLVVAGRAGGAERDVTSMIEADPDALR